MTDEVINLVHAGRKDAGAGVFAKFCGMPTPELKPAVWDEILLNLYHWLLNNNALEEAAQLLWNPRLFDARPDCTRQVWKLFDEANMGLIMGAASMSKSYTMGVRLFLEWTRDPMYTAIKVIGPSAQHLQDNLFSHLVRLHQGASIPMPGEVGDLFIGMDRREAGSAIKGVIIPIGQNKKAGRIQGTKCFQRPKIHSVFGSMTRLFIFLDEIENVPEGVWSDIDNVLSNITENPEQSAKIFGAYNPVNPSAEVAIRAEPTFGWKDLDADQHMRWTSIRGWEVLRLDALKCENVVTGKTVYPGLQTQAGVKKIARNAGGTDSAGYLAMVRAMYPTQGSSMSVFSPGIVNNMRGQFIWYDTPVAAAGVDLALEGASTAVYTKGSFGAVTGIIYPPNLEFPNGKKVMFKDHAGQVRPKWGLQVDAVFPLPKGDTVATYESIVKMSRKLKVKPEFVCVDRTGNGAGVHDMLRNMWSLSVQGVNYTHNATERKIMTEDLQIPKDEYWRIVSELWFAMKAWAEFKYLLIEPSVDVSKIFPQLQERRYRPNASGKTKVESKEDLISRGHKSPDEAESISLLVHAVRVAHSVVLSMTGEEECDPDLDGDGSDPVRIDPTSLFESLE
jgi:hypothetical protein